MKWFQLILRKTAYAGGMGKKHLSWAPSGPLDRLVWTAPVPDGTYEVDHWTYAARFVRSAPYLSTDQFRYRFRSLEEAQAFCEQHWRLVGGDDDSSSRRRRAHQLQ